MHSSQINEEGVTELTIQLL